MRDRPTVSVVTPIYNAAPYLRASVESILRQTRGDLELVLVDDGSTDQSRAIMSEFTDPRIRAVHLPRVGLVPALNHGIEAARGRYVARMDADDVSLPERLARQVEVLEAEPEAVVTGCSVTVIDKAGERIGVVVPPTRDDDLRRRLMVRNPFAGGSVLIRREALAAIGGYPEASSAEDYAVLILLASVGALTSAPEVLYEWRIHGASTSHRLRGEQLETSRRIKAGLWAATPGHRSRRALNDRARLYRRSLPEPGEEILVAQLLETECLLAFELLKRRHPVAGLRQLGAVAGVDPRLWAAVVTDLPRRLRYRLLHSGLASRLRYALDERFGHRDPSTGLRGR